MAKIFSYSKLIITFVLIILTLLILLIYQALRVQAADFTVNTAAELNNAISEANNESDNPGTDTITFSANITLTGTLNTITSEITINGNGYSLDGDSSYRVLEVSNSGNLTINQLNIINGHASNGGGAGILNEGILIVNFSTFANNSAINSTPIGGGIYNDVGNVTINNSTFTNNSALSGGAIQNNGVMIINNSTISGNTVEAGNGGGIMNSAGATLTLNNNTIANNSAGSNQGGGIRNDGVLNYSSTIIANNSGGDCSLGVSGEISSTNYNLVEDSSCSPAYDDDPSLGTLANNGGPTQTHALLSDSIAIDKVPTGGIDQRGAAKNFDGGGDGDTGLEGDIGAYELREIFLDGDCAGPVIVGPRTFMFSSGQSVTIDLDISDGINCISVEEMGASHLMATGPGASDYALQTGNWWHISGNINNGFNVDITLPFSDANDASRVCKWPGILDGYGWDCGSDSDNDPGPTPGNITRTNITSFSDWAVGDNVGPTAVKISNMNVKSRPPLMGFAVLIFTVITASFIVFKKIK